jgi:aspartate aminotransferase-like enzyme
MNITTPPPKVIGAMKHLLLELQKVGIIDEIDRDHLNDRYIRGHINSFGCSDR